MIAGSVSFNIIFPKSNITSKMKSVLVSSVGEAESLLMDLLSLLLPLHSTYRG